MFIKNLLQNHWLAAVTLTFVIIILCLLIYLFIYKVLKRGQPFGSPVPVLRTVLRGHSMPVNSVIFSPDGKTVASGSDDRTLILWDVRTGEKKRVLDRKS